MQRITLQVRKPPLIYVQLYYQEAVKFGDFVVSVWWCFEYYTSDNILMWKHKRENASVSVKYNNAKKQGVFYELWCLGKEVAEDIQIIL